MAVSPPYKTNVYEECSPPGDDEQLRGSDSSRYAQPVTVNANSTQTSSLTLFDNLPTASSKTHFGILKRGSEHISSLVNTNHRDSKPKISWNSDIGQRARSYQASLGNDYANNTREETLLACTNDRITHMPPLKKRLSSTNGLGLGVSGFPDSLNNSVAQPGASYDFHPSKAARILVETPKPIEGQGQTPRATFTRGLQLISEPLENTPFPNTYYGLLAATEPNFGDQPAFYGNPQYGQQSVDALQLSQPFSATSNLTQDDINRLLVRVPFRVDADQRENSNQIPANDNSAASSFPTHRHKNTIGLSKASNFAASITEKDKARWNEPSSRSRFESPIVGQQVNVSVAGISLPNLYSTIKCKPEALTTNHDSAKLPSSQYQYLLGDVKGNPSTSGSGISSSIDKGCICKRSRCLKLYCKCFQTGIFCELETCKCNECRNLPDYNEPGGLRSMAIRDTLIRRPDAFESRPLKKTGEGCACKKNRYVVVLYFVCITYMSSECI